ncbi:TRAP transporter substrate-binding protein [Petroclostridium sp. X23]|uniref:TRAP transporter substrate-binding protein n=1 Tax=Petroclostridium sp. X23 TaxID=3045146 RepID=UPI0024AE6396|nr:TRAP transporter substrate-binding protein [Petroclostridium sp. X23]WHH58218.1 TRAP transporter substrate-binding protein [Petroclostridium sp. X23]
MFKLRKLVSLICVVTLIFSLFVGCTGTKKDSQNSGETKKEQKTDQTETPEKQEDKPANTVTLKIAHYYAPEHPVNQALLNNFKNKVEKETNGEVKVEVYPNNQLGNEQEYIEGIQLGTVEMGATGNMWENTIPQFRLMQMPYMFVNYDHADAVLNGPIGEKIFNYLEKLNVKVLASFPNGFRVVSNNKKPINSIEDTKGIKLRVFEGKTIIAEMKALGFDTVVMPLSEVFTALQQKVVDGQDNPLSTSYYAGMYEVQKYVAITNHMYSPGYIVINNDIYNKLSDNAQKVLTEAAHETTTAILNAVKKQQDDIIKDITGKGVEVTYPDLKPFIEKVEPIVAEYVKEQPEMKDIVDEINKLGQEYLKK